MLFPKEAIIFFPNSLEQLQNMAEIRKNGIINKKAQISRLQDQNKQQQTQIEILEDLKKSWQESDPGKYDDSYFFLNKGLERVVAKEFLSDGVVCKTREEWDTYVRTSNHSQYYEKVPFKYPVITLDQVAQRPCPKCRESLPLIEYYAQTEDSPGGDAWLEKLLIVCFACDEVTVLRGKTSDQRFH